MKTNIILGAILLAPVIIGIVGIAVFSAKKRNKH
jgi:hypothetical protein